MYHKSCSPLLVQVHTNRTKQTINFTLNLHLMASKPLAKALHLHLLCSSHLPNLNTIQGNLMNQCLPLTTRYWSTFCFLLPLWFITQRICYQVRFLIDMKDLLNKTALLITPEIPQGDTRASGLGFSWDLGSNYDFISDSNWLFILDDLQCYSEYTRIS